MLRVFVSSTFRDFQTERDYIRNTVQPELSDALKKHGIGFSFTDLRWGINTESEDEENEKKVLSVCINEIKRAKPYTIVLLGERYGYIPDEKLIRMEAERNHVNIEDAKISATQFEIEFAAFQKEAENNHVFFYIREMECPENSVYSFENSELKKKQDALKKRISKFYADRVRFYKAELTDGKPDSKYIEKLGKDIVCDLKSSIMKDLEHSRELHSFERDNISQWNFLINKKEHFLARKSLAENLAVKIKQQKARVAIIGETGLGKSTMFAEVVDRCKSEFNLVLPFFCGSSTHTSTEKDILGELVYLLESHLGESHIEKNFETKDFIKNIFQKTERIKELRVRLAELLGKVTEKKERILIAVDAIDQLSDIGIKNNFLLLADRCDSVSLLVTGTDETLISENFEKIILSKLSEKEKEEVTDRLLYVSGKELSDKTRKCLFEKKNTDNPLYLYLLVQRLLLLQSEDYRKIYLSESTAESTQKRLREIIREATDDVEEMAFLLIEAIEKISSVSILPLAEAIAVSRFGLRQSDLEALYQNNTMKLTTLDLVLFVNYIDEICFYRSDGQIDFMHKCIRNAVLNHIDNPLTVHNSIICSLKDLSDDDNVKNDEFQYHLIKARKKKMYIEYISSLSKNKKAESILINAEGLFKLAVNMGTDGVKNFLTDFDNWNDNEPYYSNKSGAYYSKVAFEDYAAFLFYFCVQLKSVADETRAELSIYLIFCKYCVEKTESLYQMYKDNQENVKLFSDCLSCLQEVYYSFGMYEKAVAVAEKAYDLWDEAVSLNQTEADIIKLIHKLIAVIICKQNTGTEKYLEEAVESSGDIRFMMASVIEKRPVLHFVDLFLLSFLLEGTTLYNMDPLQYREKAIRCLKDGLEFLRGYERDVINEHFSDIEWMFLQELSKFGETDSVTDVLSLAKDKLKKAEREFISSLSTASQCDVLSAIEDIITILKESDSPEILQEAMAYANLAVGHAESVNEAQQTDKSLYALAQTYIYGGEIYYKIHKLTDDNVSDSMAFNCLIYAKNCIDKLTVTENDIASYINRFDINDRIYRLLSEMPEQLHMAVMFLIEEMEIADEIHNKFTSWESDYVYLKARLNVAVHNIRNSPVSGRKVTLEILEEVEVILSKYAGKPGREDFDILMNTALYCKKLLLSE